MSPRSRTSRHLVVAALLAVPLLAGCGSDDEPSTEGACSYEEQGPASRDVDLPPADPTVSGTVDATIALESGAELQVALDAAAAPCTVGSFVSLAEQGYYDGVGCHRLTVPPASIQVLQCGDPTGSGRGGPGYTIPDELEQTVDYPAGVLAMANTGAPDSGGSQFFFVYGDTALPPQYTVFGTLDDASLATLQGLVAAGTTSGEADGAPATPVTFATVSID